MALATIQSRLTETQLTDFVGNSVPGLNFDLGVWIDHRESNYTGYTGEAFPPLDQESNKAVNQGTDLSHARRFVHVFETLYKNRDVTGLSFPNLETITRLSNQFAYGAFNKDFDRPLFYNFFSGVNGWYRVEYHNSVS